MRILMDVFDFTQKRGENEFECESKMNPALKHSK